MEPSIRPFGIFRIQYLRFQGTSMRLNFREIPVNEGGAPGHTRGGARDCSRQIYVCNPCQAVESSAAVSTDTSSISGQDAVNIRLRRHLLCTALWIAALANVLIPTVLFSVAQFFGAADIRYRALVAGVVVGEYAIAFLLILMHANVGFSAGYTAATAATATVGSGVLTYITLAPTRWSSSALPGEILVLGGLAFAVLSNLAFLVASIRYGRAIHPRLHLGGFFLGIGAFLALVALYFHSFR